MLQSKVNIQDHGEACSESEAKHSTEDRTEEVFQGLVQKGQGERRCAVEAPDILHSLSFVPFARNVLEH